MQPVIEIKNLGKRYDITHQRGGYVALRDVLANVFKNPFSFLKSKAKRAIGLEKKEEFWALKDISFNVLPGEVIGIIGKNGAGKSTLLKILTGITPPTEGEVIMHGRVSSLLEVGTGFHPELSGRENIFLNGAILGMTKKEITQKFDEIVEFSGIGKFLDTPVKHYSSGMQVRLAFSVAAHMEPDILIVDEVLAVGDAEFQKKSMGKMEEVTTKQGRTILFVSHNLSAIKRLCKKTVLLEKGEVKMYGETQEVIEEYLQSGIGIERVEWTGVAGNDSVVLHKTSVRSIDATNSFESTSPIEISIEGVILESVNDLILGFTLFSEFNQKLAYVLYDDNEKPPSPTVQPGPFKKRFIIPPNTLAQGKYRIEVDIGIHRVKRIVENEGELVFTVRNSGGLGQRFILPDGKGVSSFFRPDWAIKEK